MRCCVGDVPIQAQAQALRRPCGARQTLRTRVSAQKPGFRSSVGCLRLVDAAFEQPQLVAAAVQRSRADRTTSFVCRASASEASGASSQQPLTARELLAELGVPESRVDSTLEAAKCVFKAPKELRPVLQFHDDGTPLEPQEGSSATSTPPWELLSQREGWLADARSTVALLLELGVAREQVGDVLSSCPQLLALHRDELQHSATFLKSLGIEPPQLANVVASAPRLLCFSVPDHLEPAMEYLENAGISRAVLLNLFRDQPTFVLSAVDHKVVTDQAASFIKAAYMVQNEQRVEYALKMATEIRSSLKQGSGFSWG